MSASARWTSAGLSSNDSPKTPEYLTIVKFTWTHTEVEVTSPNPVSAKCRVRGYSPSNVHGGEYAASNKPSRGGHVCHLRFSILLRLPIASLICDSITFLSSVQGLGCFRCRRIHQNGAERYGFCPFQVRSMLTSLPGLAVSCRSGFLSFVAHANLRFRG